MTGMYITIALRHLAKRKLFSFINIAGLAIGITFSLLIAVYIWEEKQVNHNLKDLPQQYYLQSAWKEDNMFMPLITPAPLAKTLKDQYPSLVANYYRTFPCSANMSYKDRHFRMSLQPGDTTAIGAFGLSLLQGDPAHPFRDNNSIVITEETAMKFFGRTDVLDEVLTIDTRRDGKKNYAVTGVLKRETRLNTVTTINGFKTDVFLPMQNVAYFLTPDADKDWNSVSMASYITLQPGVKPEQLAAPIRKLVTMNCNQQLKDNMSIQLVGMDTFYLDTNNGLVRKMCYILAVIAFFVLLMAVINYVNISIGTSVYRLKEIGLRKVFGGKRQELITQFLAESLVLTAIAAFLSIAFFELLRPLFGQVLNKTLPHVWSFSGMMVLFYVLLVAVVGLIAGIYPAFVLTASHLLKVLKGKISVGKGELLFRKGSLVIQFSLAVLVFVCTLYISRQIDYFFKKELGYSKEQLLVIASVPRQWDAEGLKRIEQVRDEMMRNAGVKSATISYEVPDGMNGGGVSIMPRGGTSDAPVNVGTLITDGNYAATFGLKMLAGAFFTDQDNPADVVLNESAVKALHLKTGVGEQLVTQGPQGGTFRVKGIVKDFHFTTMQQKISPMMFLSQNTGIQYRFLSIKLQTADARKAVAGIESVWKARFPDAPFEYFFMDDKFQSMYTTETRLKQAANVASALNFIIILLGAAGVVAFSLTRRTKEIGVRKVLGANTRNIIYLFLKEYTSVILIANLIAWPVAYIIADHWLDDYAYRTSMSVTPFIIAGAVTFSLTYILIALQCFRTASANPTGLLRSE
ncbi:ABC transporter permease [Chitinophaga filiformis]|uniref:Putative ABC transport system permease protein n=1 Tax=Chitinophaga filiformis TaxID=104663 RepID=A0A1G7UQ62_CHIFI|nr:ABC transporter permease [Chitinophaga filiformis]SDG49702.1 putative ABC transport system permease protein [Chitinophaga filiformis]